MQVEYHLEHPRTSRTAFVKMREDQRARVRLRLFEQLQMITEQSVVPNSELWQIATESVAEIWGRNRAGHENTMLSVLVGALSKLQVGDLTPRQLEFVERIDQVFAELGLMTRIEYTCGS